MEPPLADAPDVATETDAPPAGIEPELWDEISRLDTEEQRMLAGVVSRGTRDRDVNGPVDEIALVTNALKTHDSDDVSVMMKLEEKIAPPVQLRYPEAERTPLDPDLLDVEATLADVLIARRSRRNYAGTPMSLQELSTLLTLGYGARERIKAYNLPEVPIRSVPTAGGLQCVELYAVVISVEGLEPGIYHFDAADAVLELVERGSFRYRMTDVVRQAEWITDAAVVLFLAPVLPRISWKYDRRALRMVHIDSGIVVQTLHLAATALRLRSCVVLGFGDEDVDELLGLDGRTQSTTIGLVVGRHPWEEGPEDARPSGDGAAHGWTFGRTS